MTAIARFTRVAVAVALGATAPLVLHVDAQAAPAVPRLIAVAESSAAPVVHRARPTPTDTSARRDRGHSERTPVAPKRRSAPKAKSGASSAPQSGPGGQYIPDQPWETEFFVDNTLPTRHFALRFASIERK